MLASVVHIIIDPARGKTRIRVEKIMEDYQVRHAAFEPLGTAEGHLKGTVTFVLPQRHRRDLLCALAAIPEVLEIVPEPAGRSPL